MPPMVHIPIEAPKRKRGRPVGNGKKNSTISLPPKEQPVTTPTAQSIEVPLFDARIHGIHIYSHAKVKMIEQSTGLVYAGSFAEGNNSAGLVPVFLKPGRTEDEVQEKLSFIRRK